MKRYYYDLHLHSCLSPCGSEDMTPNNIAGMAELLEQDIIALTDHNSVRNCEATAAACEMHGILFVPGMELCTCEEAHIVCLLPDLSAAERLERRVWETAPRFPNDTEKLGHQQIMDARDRVIGEFEHSLTLGTAISIDEVFSLVNELGGVAYPAHIDRPSYSVISTLGVFPDWAGFTACEITKNGNEAELTEKYPCIAQMPHILSSDAHYLENMNERRAWAELPERSAECLIAALRGELGASFGRR